MEGVYILNTNGLFGLRGGGGRGGGVGRESRVNLAHNYFIFK